ncbi:EAL domain-containing protein [Bacillus sp. FJAT-29790]|uniref:EAL domain-containing protein n=1 Tax=Bacillus sp. FJAT-29790 TaxID=1895002 RepID=UPI001C22DAC2|nr:EAL domain-containing protein [Bacillus sp. FJAT-29790]MBU8880803.1 EAL domain-containing protein [Bacillus sp. FJAT-29790]
MIRRHIQKITHFLKWMKILLPLKKIRFYPPQFIVRDPITDGVKRVFDQGFEVAVVVFNIKNLRELLDVLGQQGYNYFIATLKKTFRLVIEQEVENEDIIVLHDYSSDGLTLFIRMDHNRHCVTELDKKMKKVARDLEKSLALKIPLAQPILDTGYMFIEKQHYSIQEAVQRAHQQAIAMAEKRVQSEFNEMLYSVSKVVAKKNIRLLAQPIINVATGEVRAWEMLTRGPEGTVLESPLQLFSVARQTGLLYDLELIVFEKILEQIHDTGCSQEIFINFTPISLGNEQFVRDIKKMLAKHKNISPYQMILEITERDSIEGMENFIYNIKILRSLGFRVAIDDTGAGYASLHSISEIMPDIIKIDRSVIHDIDKNLVKESMLKGLLLIARAAGSLVVAEGIESKEEASVLTRNKVDLAQGYYYARPDTLKKGLKSS